MSLARSTDLSSSFGVEQEHFIFRDGLPPSRSDVESLFLHLSRFGYVAKHDATGSLRGAAKKTRFGSVAVMPDFCTHILELVFPPLRSFDEFYVLYEQSLGEVQAALTALGMSIVYGGSLPNVPVSSEIFYSSPAAQDRGALFVDRILPSAPFANRLFFAAMAATQVHIATVDRPAQLLPVLYRFEYLIPLMFCTESIFAGRRALCARSLMYRDGFDERFWPAAYPAPVARSIAEYDRLLASSTPQLKDYSLIALRKHGLEFRSACSQETVGRIIELVAMRFLMLASANTPSAGASNRREYYELCERGDRDEAMVDDLLSVLQAGRAALPKKLDPHLDSAIARLGTDGRVSMLQ